MSDRERGIHVDANCSKCGADYGGWFIPGKPETFPRCCNPHCESEATDTGEESDRPSDPPQADRTK